ncbi:ClpP/crotonase [Ceraceosorus guamensis]|uniref:ClpP/crotonase n=1 Tax=Ceraceosorus guamensis TaxID=1522189 RepID=A0A316VQW7_9BASI|nr:ClpP/crotonase [Ceraceosorus guamensis]PWN38793.1 ClpP/crotonase [Ceraceosorus guamensis]
MTDTSWRQTSSMLKTRRPAPRVLQIAICNPPFNLLNGDVLDQLAATLRSLTAHDTGAVILGSDLPDIYISHYDVGEIADLGDLIPHPALSPPAALLRGALHLESLLSLIGLRWLVRKSPLGGMSNLNSYHECTALLRSVPQVTIAMINGRAFGGGCELALACDLRIMVDTPAEGIAGAGQAIRGSGIGQPEITLGLIPGGGGTQMLTRNLGPAKAIEICLEKPLLRAAEALQLGLVTRLVPARDLLQTTLDMAIKLSKRSPAAVAAIKDCVHIGASSSLFAGMQREKAHFAVCAMQPEAQVAMHKYLDGIDGILGSQGGLEAFEDLDEGIFSDLTPGSAAAASSAAATAATAKPKSL